MSDDLLARATRALREETAGDDASARFTRSRVMASVHEERVRRRTRWAFLIPIAATFIAASAYGAATGKTREVLLVVTRALGIHRSEPPSVPPRRTQERPVTQASPAPTPVEAPPAPPATVETSEPAAESAASAAPAAPKSAPPPTADPKGDSTTALSHALPDAGDAGVDPVFELYRSAHHAHFVERDYGRALSAWDAYLRAAPNGALAPEARYNRALCLVRLHRSDDARAALKPFAEGRYGTYRREDAERLLSVLPAELPGP